MNFTNISKWVCALALVGCSSGSDMSAIFNPPPSATEKLVISDAHVTSHNVRSSMAMGLNTLDVTSHATSGDVEIIFEDCNEGKTVKIQAQSGGSLLSMGTIACSAAKTTGVIVAPTLALMDKTWKFGFYQETDKSDMVTTEDIHFRHNVIVTDIGTQVTVSVAHTYAASDCKLYDRILPYAEMYIQKTRLFNETHLANMAASGQFNSTSLPVSFSSAVLSDGAGPHANKIKLNILTVTPVVTDYTMDVQILVNGIPGFSRMGMKIAVPSKTFTVSSVKYRRIYGYAHFTNTDAGLSFTNGSLMGGENITSGACEETGVFLENTGTNTTDYYTLLTLANAAAFGVDYNLEIDFQ